MPRRSKPRVAKYVQLAQQRQIADRENLPQEGYTFDEDEADAVVGFFAECLRHFKGEWAGQSLVLEDWEAEDIIKPIFGWKRPDGTRRFRIAYIEVPRKQGKSTIAGGVGIYLTTPDCDHEPAAEVYSTATKQDQAKIVWDTAKAMLRRSPELRGHLSSSANRIYSLSDESFFTALGADAHTMDGLNPHGNIVDELHAHKNRNVWDVMITGMGARSQPLTFAITTAGLYDPESIGWEQHEYARDVLEGNLKDDEYFAYIASAEPEDDWTDPEVWKMANPNYGVSVKPEYLEGQCRRAMESPSFQNTFLRYHLDIWTQQLDRWIDMRQWDQLEICDPLAFRHRPCLLGVDLATTNDLAAVAALFPDEDGHLNTIYRFYCPEETVRSVSDRRIATYNAWVAGGHLTQTPGNVIDYEYIKADIREMAKMYKVGEIGYDPYNATQFAIDMQSEGFDMVEVRQGPITLSEPSKAFEKAVMSKQLRWDGNPVMKWMASNVTAKESAQGNIMPDKSTSVGKIDGIVAAIIALSRHIRQQGSPPPKVLPHSMTRVSPNRIG